MAYTFLYSFTITLLPILYKETSDIQYDKTVYLLKEYLSSLKDLTLVAEQTKNYNIHYHGCARLPIVGKKNSVKTFVDQFRKSKQFGFINVKQIEDENGWLKYIFKDVHTTYTDTGRPPIVHLSEYATTYLKLNHPELVDPCYHGYFI